MSLLSLLNLKRKPKFKDTDFDPLKGQIETVASQLEGFGKSASKYRTAIVDAEKLRARKIKEAGAALLKAKNEADADLLLAENEYLSVRDPLAEQGRQLQS